MSSLPFSNEDHEGLEARLRAGAAAARRAPSAELHGRILAALRTARREPQREPSRAGNWIAAAAAALVLGSAWWLTRDVARPSPARTARLDVVAFSRELFGAGTRVLTLPNQAEDSLRLEGQNLWRDASHVAEGVVRGLPGPLRVRLAKL